MMGVGLAGPWQTALVLPIDRYVEFLKSGSSRPILDLLRHLAADLMTSRPVEEALATFDRLVSEMESVAARVGGQ